MADTAGDSTTPQYEAIIVGAGFGGIASLYELRRRGFAVRLLEASDGVGGVWYGNRYPGARCDAEVFDYSFSFSQELEESWTWSERYASQPELQAYFEHVVDRFDLARDIQLETQVTSARFDDSGATWTVGTAGGERFVTRFLITAVGCLSVGQLPDIAGIDSYKGLSLHTSAWPKEGIDFSGRRVGLIGTGSSGIQVAPHIARQADHLFVFQRSANHVVPAQNHPLSPELHRKLRATNRERRARAAASPFGLSLVGSSQLTADATPQERHAEYERRWALGGFNFLVSFADILFDAEANRSAGDFLRAKISETVADPAVAELLQPGGHPLGTKRLSIGIDYLETFNRDNVTLVAAVNEPIESVTAAGIRTSKRELELDAIVFATGFDAFTGALTRMDIHGRGGCSLNDAWSDGPRTYLGLGVAGFPNLFNVGGAGSPSVLSNAPVSSEQHGYWIGECMDYMRTHEIATVEPAESAQDQWVGEVNAIADMTLHRGDPGRSWYTGANTAGKTPVFMAYLGGVHTYSAKLEQVVMDDYDGFVFAR